jgi:hypothetical protein
VKIDFQSKIIVKGKASKIFFGIHLLWSQDVKLKVLEFHNYHKVHNRQTNKNQQQKLEVKR